MEYKKFNLYEPLLSTICRMADDDAGKFIKFLYEYVFDYTDGDDMFYKEKKNYVELIIFANKTFINNIKNEKRTKKDSKYIIFYSWYTEYFNTLNDCEAGRLIKKISDEELKTTYTKDNKNATEILQNYNTLMAIYEEYRRDFQRKKRPSIHDFGRIKKEFPKIKWEGFNKNKEPYKSVNCVKLYDYLKQKNMEDVEIHINEAIELYRD